MAEEEFDDFAEFEEEVKAPKKKSKEDLELEKELAELEEEEKRPREDLSKEFGEEEGYEEVINTPNLGVVRKRGRPMKEDRPRAPVPAQQARPTPRPEPRPAPRPVQYEEPEQAEPESAPIPVQNTRREEVSQPRYAPLIMPSRFIAFDTETKTALTEAADIESLKVQLLFEILNRLDKLEKAL